MNKIVWFEVTDIVLPKPNYYIGIPAYECSNHTLTTTITNDGIKK